MSKLYTSRLCQLEDGTELITHATRLKNKLLAYFPQLEQHSEGRDILLVPSGAAGTSIRKTCELNCESETVIMSGVADIIRRDMFNFACPPFNGTFTEDCQHKSVPPSLVTLITMILHGTSIQNETDYKSQAALSLSQLLMHNCSRQRTEQTDTRHSRSREPPLPLFLGAYVHSKTRSKDMVETFCKMGLSVTYDRVLCMSADLAISAINYFALKGAVCPQSLKSGHLLFHRPTLPHLVQQKVFSKLHMSKRLLELTK